MLRKAREKAKEGLRSVKARSGHPGGHGRPRQPAHYTGSAAISFKGVNDDFEAILNDESDFTNQFDFLDELEASGSSAEGLVHEPSHVVALTTDNGDHPAGNHLAEGRAVDNSLFSDPVFPESDRNQSETHAPLSDDVDPLIDALGESKLSEGSSHNEGETDTSVIPDSEDNLQNDFISHSDTITTLSKDTGEPVPPEQVSDSREQLRPDSPLFSDDITTTSVDHEGGASKDGKLSAASIFVTQPSDEGARDLKQNRGGETEDDLFGEQADTQLAGNDDLAKAMTPELPDLEELEHKMAIHRTTGIPIQDFFSSEESPFSSLPSSYEGEKELPFMAATLPPPNDSNQEIKSNNIESELTVESETTVDKEVSRGSAKQPDSQEHQNAYSLDKELEMLLTPKVKSKTAEGHDSDVSTVHSTEPMIDDPLHSSQVEGPERERARSHLDSGVFEQSSNSVVLKSTPEREESIGKHGDDLFIIDEDHFKDDESTPVVARRPLTKGTSNVEISHSKKSLNNTLSAPNILPVGSKASPSPPTHRRSVKTTPPPRPALSPKLKQKMMQKQQTPSSGVEARGHQHEGEARRKLVQPLGCAPPASDHSPTRLETALGSVTSTTTSPHNDSNASSLSAKVEEKRIPADDLFLEDNLVTSNSEAVTSKVKAATLSSDKGDQTEAVPKEATPGSNEEETDYYFHYHLFFATCLYFYYSLNIFPYLSGFFAGFFALYLTVGSVFIFYVQTVEKYQTGDRKEDKLLEPSREFTERMHVDFENLRVYKSKRFTATLTYDHTTHHPSQRKKASVHLINDFELYVKVYDDNAHANNSVVLVDVKTNIRTCEITLVPEEVAKNRKRRWSKKFPIKIFNPPPNTYRVYLFSPHARDKEDWFRRLKHANQGLTSKQVIEKEKRFFAYMQHYFPTNFFPSTDSKRSSSRRSSKHGHPQKPVVARVRYSVKQDQEEDTKTEASESVSFKGSPKAPHSHQLPPSTATAHGSTGSSSVDDHQLSHTLSKSSSVDSEFEIIPHPQKLSKTYELQWLNAVAARLCWDIWHEQRWKDWVTTRIQKKLIRVKTPSFMEQLRLTDVKLGNDMPVVQRLREGPKLDLRGIWVYLDVTYSGKFVMTIETKMKLGKENQSEEKEGQQMTAMSRNKESSLPHRVPGQHHSTRPTGRGMTHHHAAKMLGTSVDPCDHEIDSGSDDEESVTALEAEATSVVQSQDHQDHLVHLPGGRKEKLKSMVSKITKKVANTKIVQRAAQKVSSYPLVLTVEVRRLDGILAVNIPPPPTDTIWYGFKGPPNLYLVAKPRLGNREVKLSRVTHWIERKLQELVNKKLVLPEMEDLVIPILNSGIPEDELKPISSDSAPSSAT